MRRLNIYGGSFTLECFPTADNIADFFTKPLSVELFERFRAIIMYLWGTSDGDI